MRTTSLIAVILIGLLLQGCAAGYLDGIAVKTVMCGDEAHPILDCNLLYGQTASLTSPFRFVLTVSDEAQSGFSGESNRSAYDSATADQFNNIQQLCVQYNNCLITKANYLQQMTDIRSEQFKVRQNSSQTASFSTEVNMGGYVEPQSDLYLTH
jgi:hypothetical protein